MKLKHIALAVAFIGSCNPTITLDTSTTFASEDSNQGMRYIEYHMITKPQRKMKMEHAHFGAAGALATAIYAGSVARKNGLTEVSRNDIIKVGFAVGITTALYYKLIACFRAQSIYTSNVIDFVKNWDHHKAFTDQRFHELFDSLADLFENEGEEAVAIYTHEIIDIISFHLSHEFSSRYPAKSGSFADTLKTVTDVAKNLNDLNG